MTRALVAVLLLGLAIRLAAAASSSVYVDEAYTYFLARSSPTEILTGARPDFNTPAWYFVLHSLAEQTHDRLLLRLPSVLCGVAALVLAFLLGGPRLGLLTAAVAAAAYPAWLADAQIRAYGILTWAVLAVTYLALHRPRTPVFLAVCLVVPLFHHLGVAVLLAVLLTALVYRDGKQAACAAAGLAVAGLWLAYALSGPSSEIRRGVLDLAAGADALRAPAYLSGLALPLHAMPVLPPAPVEWALSAVLWALAAYGATRLPRRQGLLLALVVLGPLAALALGATLGVQPYQHRYMAPLLAPFFLLVFHGLPRAGAQALAGAMLAVNLGAAVLFPTTPYLWNQDWDAVARFIRQRQGPRDAIAAYVPYSLVGFSFAYAPGTVDWDFSTPLAVQARFPADYAGLPMYGLHPAGLGPALEDNLQGRRLFMILNQEDAGGVAIRTWLGQRYGVADALELTGLQSWGRITVYLLEPLGGR